MVVIDCFQQLRVYYHPAFNTADLATQPDLNFNQSVHGIISSPSDMSFPCTLHIYELFIQVFVGEIQF